MFEDIGHSKGARRQLAKFQVGVGEVLAATKDVAHESGSSGAIGLFFVAVAGVLLAVAVWSRL
jgi:hypothetical protein